MNIQTNTWVFQNSATTTGNGTSFQTGRNNQMTVYVIGSGSFTVVFEGSDSESTPNWYAIPAVKLLDLTVVSSTSTNGAYVIDLAHFVSVRCRISSITGTVKVVGRIVDVGSTLLSNLLTTVNATVTTPIQTSLLTGTSTSNGTTATLVDSTKNIVTNALNNKTIKFTIGTTEYVRTITSSTGSTIGFVDTSPAVAASVTVTGSTGGSMVINCKSLGASGNDYSVILVAGTGVSQSTTASFADNLLTITSPTDGSGNPTDILPGNVESIIDGTPELAALFDVGAFEAGKALDILAESVPFTGGSDGVIVGSGVDYVVF